MEKFIHPTQTREGFRRQVETKRADNVKIVDHPIHGRVYVCPYPPEHFSELKEDTKRILALQSRVKFDKFK